MARQNVKTYHMPSAFAALFTLQSRRNYPYAPPRSLGDFRQESPATSSASSIKSATRKSARPPPMTTSGSGETMSVHCGGTEQTILSWTCSKSRLPNRL